MRLGLFDMAGTVKLDDSNLGGQEIGMGRRLKLGSPNISKCGQRRKNL